MKHLLLTLLFVVAPMVGYSQTTWHFTYDNAGNRTSRTIVVRSQEQAPSHNVNTSVDLFEDAKVRIKDVGAGHLQIEIPGIKGHVHVTIFDASGKSCLSSDLTDSVSHVDISAVPRGVYVLMIDIDGEENTWKLIKK